MKLKSIDHVGYMLTVKGKSTKRLVRELNRRARRESWDVKFTWTEAGILSDCWSPEKENLTFTAKCFGLFADELGYKVHLQEITWSNWHLALTRAKYPELFR